MARPRRIERPGGCCHLTAGGNGAGSAFSLAHNDPGQLLVEANNAGTLAGLAVTERAHDI